MDLLLLLILVLVLLSVAGGGGVLAFGLAHDLLWVCLVLLLVGVLLGGWRYWGYRNGPPY